MAEADPTDTAPTSPLEPAVAEATTDVAKSIVSDPAHPPEADPEPQQPTA